MPEEKFTKKDYWKMSNDELIAILVEKEIPFDPEKLNRKDAIDQLVIRDATDGDLTRPIEIDEDGETGEVKIRREFVDVIFHNQKGEPKYVFLGLNGRFLYLPRECLCRIPAEYLEVIKNSAFNRLVQFEKDGKLTYRTVRTPRISYEVVDRGVIG